MIDWQRSYCGPAPGPDGWITQWNFDPVLLFALAGAALLSSRLADGRRTPALVAVGVLAIAFVSPLCALSTALFAARAVHHLLIVGVAAPLLALAIPRFPRIGVTLSLPLATATLWAWHLPALYDAALANVLIYWAMQISLLASAWMFWSSAFRASTVESMAGIVGGAVQMGFLGALLTFAGRPLYASHLATTVRFGVGPLADQQLAGLVMWVPGMTPYALAAALIVHRRWKAMTAQRIATA